MKTRTLPPVSAISDVLALWGHDGWLTPPLAPIVPAREPLAGSALTITMTTGSSGPGLSRIYDVLSSDLSGRVLVIAGASAVPGAVWGEILTRAALQQGASAVLVDGFVRDRPAMESLALPVYANGERIVGPNAAAHITAVGEPVTIDATIVASGDSVVIDATGCARIRAAEVDDLLQAAQRYAEGEDLVVKALSEGEPLSRAYRHKKAVTDELRR